MSWVWDSMLRLFKEPRINPLMKQWLASWTKGMTLEKSHLILPHSSWGICKALWHHQLKNPSGSLWFFSSRLSLITAALGGGRINIWNGRSCTKGQIALCTQYGCLFCTRTGWLSGRGLWHERTLTLNAASVWGSWVHSLPLLKGTNAQQLHPEKDCSEIISQKQSMEELLGKLVNFNLPRIRMLTSVWMGKLSMHW